jgi:hypothetical protein
MLKQLRGLLALAVGVDLFGQSSDAGAFLR